MTMRPRALMVGALSSAAVAADAARDAANAKEQPRTARAVIAFGAPAER